MIKAPPYSNCDSLTGVLHVFIEENLSSEKFPPIDTYKVPIRKTQLLYGSDL